LVIHYNNRKEVNVGPGETYTKSTNDEIYGLTSETLDNLAEDFSGLNPALILIGYFLMIVYCGLAFVYFDWVNSHVSVGLVSSLILIYIYSTVHIRIAVCMASIYVYYYIFTP